MTGPTDTPSLNKMVKVFGRIGLLSFGGPAAQISLMHKELVEKRDWMEEQTFLSALSFCMLLPGPEAMQLATYAGWRIRGVLGGLIGGLLFVLPGALVIFALALAYAIYGNLPWVETLFYGIQSAVIVIVLQALLNISKKALTFQTQWIIAGLSFFGIYALGIPFPLIILVAALLGYVGSKATKRALPPPPQHRGPLKSIVIWGSIWLAPIAFVLLSGNQFLEDVALFFSQLAVVTFGGAYAVLAYMTQAIVTDYNWLTTKQMVDALGLAETTPGPLILVTQFTAVLAGMLQGGIGLAMLAGLLCLWVTFAPCFLWIFAGAPYVDYISNHPRLSAAMTNITAAVVGVILNLSIWFALHILFETHYQSPIGMLPDPATLRLLPTLLLASAAIMSFKFNISLPKILTVNAVLALALNALL